MRRSNRQMEAAAASPPAQALGGSDVNEAFLVNGSLSGGLQSVQQQNFFDQLDQDQTVAQESRRNPKAISRPAKSAPRKAAKKAKKKKSLGDTVNSFGAAKQESQIKGNVLYTFRNSAFDASPYSLSGQP